MKQEFAVDVLSKDELIYVSLFGDGQEAKVKAGELDSISHERACTYLAEGLFAGKLMTDDKEVINNSIKEKYADQETLTHKHVAVLAKSLIT